MERPPPIICPPLDRPVNTVQHATDRYCRWRKNVCYNLSLCEYCLPLSICDNWTFFARCYDEMLQANISSKWSFFNWVGQFGPNCRVEWNLPANHLCTVSTLPLCWYSSKQIHFYTIYFAQFAFLSHPLRSLGAMYAVHLRLIEKFLVDFLFMIIELFLLGVTAEELRANIGWKSVFFEWGGWIWPKISGSGNVPHKLFFISEN